LRRFDAMESPDVETVRERARVNSLLRWRYFKAEKQLFQSENG
jgi:hypothetical protein